VCLSQSRAIALKIKNYFYYILKNLSFQVFEKIILIECIIGILIFLIPKGVLCGKYEEKIKITEKSKKTIDFSVTNVV